VLMADGNTKPIDKVHVGDTLTNAQPGTAIGAKDQHHHVTALHVTLDDRAYTDVTIAAGHGLATITGTAYHLYWDATTRLWTAADKLRVGDRLQSSSGASTVIVALHSYTASMVTYNLTVDEVHTYYVVAGKTPILVHNCGYDLRGIDPMEIVPDNASVRELRPDPNGGAQYGVEFKWTNKNVQTVRMRIHGPDGTAPAGSNAASGDTFRVQIGGRYQDVEGNLYPRNVHSPNSPNYDPAAANNTHIPWPSQYPGL
jgi:hypothetical protein